MGVRGPAALAVMIKQTKAQALGRSGERWFRAMLPSEWIFQPPEEDIGLDGKVIIGTSHSTGDLEFGVQIKTKQRWRAKGGVISVSGIRSDTVRYWGTRLFPTMLVLHDSAASSGYWGWLYDITLPPLALLKPRTKKVTLKLSTGSPLTETSWEGVRKDVETFYEKFVFSLSAIRLRINALPTIHSLTMALDLLLTAEFEEPKDNQEETALQLAQVMAHSEVLTSLANLVRKFGIEPDSPHDLNHFLGIYRELVQSFVADLDTLLKRDRAVAVRTNPEAMAAARPRLIRMLSDLVVRLTGNLPERLATTEDSTGGAGRTWAR